MAVWFEAGSPANAGEAERNRCERLFRRAQIFDGTGVDPTVGDVAVTGDRIVAIGQLSDWAAEEEIDLNGLSIAPGFIDAHSHDDLLLVDAPEMTPKLSQGVTTVVVGNCGVSLAPYSTAARGIPPMPMTEVGPAEAFRYESFATYMEALRAAPPAINAACLVGHTTLRAAVMDDLSRAATCAEQAAMARLVEEAIAAGAIGLSSGLFYPPAYPAPAAEVAELAKIVGREGGVYCAHVRSEAEPVIDALDEAVGIARSGGVPLIISHHKVMGAPNFGRSRETLRHLTRAATAHEVGFDVYPYTSGASMLSKDIWRMASRAIITWSEPFPAMAGRDLTDAATELGLDEEAAIDALSPGGAIYVIMDEADVRRILSHPEAMIGSDGAPYNDRPHPRLWGTFPRVLGTYVRDAKLFSLAEAVRRMTSLPARRFRLIDRGVLAPGGFADLVIFDPETIGDQADFDQPVKPSSGIIAVYVNGVAAWQSNVATGSRTGRALSCRSSL